MVSAISLALLLPWFHVAMDQPGAWPEILGAIGLQKAPLDTARVVVLGQGAPATAEWLARVETGAILVLEGESSLASQFGFTPTRDFVRVGRVVDLHHLKLPIVWQRAAELPVWKVPPAAVVFTRERVTGAPLVAGLKRGNGAVLWVAASPGERGYERFPYLPQALTDLGLDVPFRSRRLWAFFDYSYRMRADVEYFAERWRLAGIAALHVAAWHFYEPDAGRDRYLHNLIEACHRNGIQVYAWLELPHVSEEFWKAHPQWREKTAAGQDAHLDWRRLMNLANPDCRREVARGVRELLKRFDWDGVNVAELYFESLEGIGNPARFTPFNDTVRAEFRAGAGFDPLEIFQRRRDARAFLDYRAALAARMEEEWLAEVEGLGLDVVLTHVDDRFDPAMKDALGVDAARSLALLEHHAFTFLIEDPATVWHLGPKRYREIAARYQELTHRQERLAIDINIAERYQDVYPTRQQSGIELLQLVHVAAASFPRVALYFESSILPPDLALLPSATAAVTRFERVGPRIGVESPQGAGVPWSGPAWVDGRAWPVAGQGVVWLPPGAHTIENGPEDGFAHLEEFNGDLQGARYRSEGAIEVSYRSGARAYARLDRIPAALEIDGAPAPLERVGERVLRLPRGQHLVTIRTE